MDALIRIKKRRLTKYLRLTNLNSVDLRVQLLLKLQEDADCEFLWAIHAKEVRVERRAHAVVDTSCVAMVPVCPAHWRLVTDNARYLEIPEQPITQANGHFNKVQVHKSWKTFYLWKKTEYTT